MASKLELDRALLFVICIGVRCNGGDNCELRGGRTGCMFDKVDKKFLADVARRRYEKREKTPELQEAMRIINEHFPKSAKVV